MHPLLSDPTITALISGPQHLFLDYSNSFQNNLLVSPDQFCTLLTEVFFFKADVIISLLVY